MRVVVKVRDDHRHVGTHLFAIDTARLDRGTADEAREYLARQQRWFELFGQQGLANLQDALDLTCCSDSHLLRGSAVRRS